MNFARRDTCNRCQTPREGGDGKNLDQNTDSHTFLFVSWKIECDIRITAYDSDKFQEKSVECLGKVEKYNVWT